MSLWCSPGKSFAEPGIVQRLKQREHMLEADGPSYLAHLYEDDPAFPAGLNGIFHGLLCDRTRQIAMLFNDRYGMHRIYYHEAKEAFYFAAEAKAILKVRPELRRADPRGLGEFVACGCVLENRTLFEGIHGSASGFCVGLSKRQRRQEKEQYFHPREWEEQEPWSLKPTTGNCGRFSRNLPSLFQ